MLLPLDESQCVHVSEGRCVPITKLHTHSPSDRVNSQLNSIEGEWRFTSSILRLDASTLFNGNGKRNLNRFHFFIC